MRIAIAVRKYQRCISEFSFGFHDLLFFYLYQLFIIACRYIRYFQKNTKEQNALYKFLVTFFLAFSSCNLTLHRMFRLKWNIATQSTIPSILAESIFPDLAATSATIMPSKEQTSCHHIKHIWHVFGKIFWLRPI